jgi:hypothetical protein
MGPTANETAHMDSACYLALTDLMLDITRHVTEAQSEDRPMRPVAQLRLPHPACATCLPPPSADATHARHCRSGNLQVMGVDVYYAG